MEKTGEGKFYGFNVVLFKNVSKEDFIKANTPNDKFWHYNPNKKELIIEK